MFSPRCLLCDHVNPAGARFCNACGSSLHLKRCSQCETVNDQAARTCSKCGMEFPGLSIQPEGGANVASPGHYGRFGSTHRFNIRGFDSDFHLNESSKPAPSAVKVTAATHASVASEPALGTAGWTPQLARSASVTEHHKLDLAFDPQRSTFEDPTPWVRVGSDRELTPEPVSAADIQDVPRRWPGNETAETRESAPEIVTREARSLGRDVTSLFSAAQHATAMVPLAKAERRPMSRVAPVVLLPTIALIAIGVSAYYVYSHSVQLREWQGAQVVPAAPSPNKPSPSDPHPQVSTSDQVTPAQQFAAKADEVVREASAATAVAGDLRRTMQAAGNEVTAKHSATNRPMRTYPAASAAGSVQSLLSDSRVNVRPDVPRPVACTEGVAALGLCSLNSRGESK